VLTTSGVDGASTVQIHRSTGLPLQWTGGTAGTVEVVIYSSGLDATCEFDAAAGSGTVPVEVTSMLGAGDGSFAIESFGERTLIAGGSEVSFRVSGSGGFLTGANID
jgi:hypothetical protein